MPIRQPLVGTYKGLLCRFLGPLVIFHDPHRLGIDGSPVIFHHERKEIRFLVFDNTVDNNSVFHEREYDNFLYKDKSRTGLLHVLRSFFPYLTLITAYSPFGNHHGILKFFARKLHVLENQQQFQSGLKRSIIVFYAEHKLRP